MDPKLKSVAADYCLIDKINKNSRNYPGLIESDDGDWSYEDILCGTIVNDKSKGWYDENCIEHENNIMVELIEVEDEWEENFKQNGYNENNVMGSSEIVDEHKCKVENFEHNDYNENKLMENSANLEVEDEYQDEYYEQNYCNKSDESDADSTSQVELIEVDEDWLNECDKKSRDCESNVMEVSLRQTEENEFDEHDDGSMNEKGNTSNNSINEVELIEVSDPCVSEENEDEFEYFERIGIYFCTLI